MSVPRFAASHLEANRKRLPSLAGFGRYRSGPKPHVRHPDTGGFLHLCSRTQQRDFPHGIAAAWAALRAPFSVWSFEFGVPVVRTDFRMSEATKAVLLSYARSTPSPTLRSTGRQAFRL